MVKRIIRLLKNLNELSKNKQELKDLQLKLDDVYSLNILQPLLQDKYTPLNGGALRPMGIVYILNEIIINQRNSILEFGSGMTTIFIARLIKKNNLNTTLVTVEHDSNWIQLLKLQLSKEGLLDSVHFIHAELVDTENDYESKWYNEEKIKKEISNLVFDFVIVDGPPANFPQIKFSRFPVLNFISKRLNENFCFFLDDANRIGEIAMIKEFLNRFPDNQSSIVSKTFFVSHSKILFNPIPLFY